MLKNISGELVVLAVVATLLTAVMFALMVFVTAVYFNGM